MGHFVAPAVRPLGWDWRIGMAVIASFPAREVIISVLGTIYSLGGDQDEGSADLRGALRESTWPDGTPVFSVPVALSIMVFFALCAQCMSTPRRHPARDRFVALGGIHLRLHDGPGLCGSSCDIPRRRRLLS